MICERHSRFRRGLAPLSDGPAAAAAQPSVLECRNAPERHRSRGERAALRQAQPRSEGAELGTRSAAAQGYDSRAVPLARHSGCHQNERGEGEAFCNVAIAEIEQPLWQVLIFLYPSDLCVIFSAISIPLGAAAAAQTNWGPVPAGGRRVVITYEVTR
jgi:hypothetical protein